MNITYILPQETNHGGQGGGELIGDRTTRSDLMFQDKIDQLREFHVFELEYIK